MTDSLYNFNPKTTEEYVEEYGLQDYPAVWESIVFLAKRYPDPDELWEVVSDMIDILVV